MSAAAQLLRRAFDAALAAVAAERVLPSALPPPTAGDTVLFAIGKAGAAMAEVAAAHLPITRGLVVVPDDHGPRGTLPEGVELRYASHPVPDARGLAAAERALALAQKLGEGDRLLALVSGGGSALLPAPVAGITLADKQALTRRLLASGATIAEINHVRQCLSRIKGGRLAAAAAPAEVVTLALSDIPGDDISLIASGPTVSSRSSREAALAVLEEFGPAPSVIINALMTPPALEDGPHVSAIVARPRDALVGAAGVLAEAGYRPIILGDAIEGEAVALARADAARALAHAAGGERVALIAGGEATVRLPSDAPIGGRNAEYALALALALDGHPAIHALACDSDGIDGTSPAAGACVTPTTLAEVRACAIDPEEALRAHRAFMAFDAAGSTLILGPTRTNVNDIRLILVGQEAI